MAKKDNTDKSTSQENLTSTESFIDRYRRILVIGGAVIVVGILAIFAYQKFVSEPHEIESQEAYWPAFYDWAEGDTTGAAINGTDEYMGFEEISSTYAGTSGGNIATYGLATMAMEKGEYQEALDYLEEVEFEDVMLGSIVLGLKGDCYVEMGDYETAVGMFEEAASREENEFTSPLYLKKAGITYEELGQNDKAVEAYQKIKDNWWESKEAQDIDKYIIRAQN